MKRKIISAAVSFAAAAQLCAVTAFAADRDLHSMLTVSPEIQMQAAALLNQKIAGAASMEHAEYYGLDDPSQLPDFTPSGYDVENMNVSYAFDLNELISTGDLKAATDLPCYDVPFFYVPFHNGSNEGAAMFSPDADGNLEYLTEWVYSDDPNGYRDHFDIKALETLLSSYAVDDLKMYGDLYIRFLWFTSGGEEYAVPYYVTRFYQEYGEMEQGTVHPWAEFTQWLHRLPLTETIADDPNADLSEDRIGGVGGAAAISEPVNAAQTEPEQTPAQHPGRLVLIATLGVGVLTAAAAFVLRLRK